MIDSSANELKVSRETADQLFKRQEESLKNMREDLHEKSNMFSSEHIQNEVLTLTSEHPSSADKFERKFQSKISPSGQKFEKSEEELIYFKEEHHVELRNVLLGPIQYEVLTINSGHPSSEDNFERKFQDKISPSEQSLENQKRNLLL